MFESMKQKAAEAAESLGEFADRNDIALMYGAACVVLGGIGAAVAVKASSTVVAAVGGVFAVSYGVGAIGSLCMIAVTEFEHHQRTKGSVRGTAEVVAG